MLETTERYHIHVFVVATIHVCKLLLQKISIYTDTIKLRSWDRCQLYYNTLV